MVTVKSVIPHSPADKAGILNGDIIVSVNGNDIRDVLDYDFYTAEKKLKLSIKRGESLLCVNISKGEYENIGCEFDTFLMDKKQSCRNKCIFCFVDQNPKGMRETVYFKDDDERMSFLSGNYITLTNLSERDVERIIKMHISPVNISVHTTEPELRVMMMANKNAGASLSIIDKLADAGIWMNMQIVLCPGINDGVHLEKTLSDLAKFIPAVKSIAIVPVGLTKHREGLFPLRSFTKDECKEVIKTVNRFGDGFFEKYGERLCFASDEFYLTAKEDLPSEEFYDGFPQLDNGVGMIRSFLSDVMLELEDAKPKKALPEKFSVATGYAAYESICKATEMICKKLYGGDSSFVNIFRIKNDFYGESVTVAGLVTGGDLIAQLKGKELGKKLYIPDVMLRYEKDKFLDDVTVSEVSEKLGVELVPVCTGGAEFAELFFK